MESQNILTAESIGYYLRRLVESWFRFFWRKRKTFLSYGAAIAVLSVGIALLTPKQYMTTATILPSTPTSPITGMLSQLGSLGLNLGTSNTSMASYYPRIINSRWVLYKTFATPFRGSTVEQILYGDPEEWQKMSRHDQEWARQQLLYKFREQLLVGLDETTSITSIQLLNKDPELSAFVINTILQNLEDYFQHSFRSEASNKLDMIEVRIGQVSDSLETIENAITEFRQRNQAYTSPALQMEMARLTRREQVNQEVYIELRKQEEVTKLEVLGSTPVVNVLDHAQVSMVPNPPTRKEIAIGIFLGGIMLLSVILRGREQRWWSEIRVYFSSMLASAKQEEEAEKEINAEVEEDETDTDSSSKADETPE